MKRSAFGTLAMLVTACGTSSGSSAPAGANVGDAQADAGGLSPNGDRPTCGSGGGTGGTPQPRGDVAGALDTTSGRLVLFGGDTAVPACPIASAHTHVGDTWLLETGCGDFRQVAGDGPPARSRHAMALNAAQNRAIMFGGRTRAGANGAYTLFSDVWAFDFASEAWQKFDVAGSGPRGRANTAVVVDGIGNQLVMFGGNDDPSGTAFHPLDDTWVMDLATGAWRALAPRKKPPARLFHAMAIDADARVAYLYSGGDDRAFTGPFFTDVWALDLAAEDWREIPTAGDAPLGRTSHGIAYDAVKKRIVLFGGHEDSLVGNMNDVRALDVSGTPAQWSKVSTGDQANKPANGQCNFPPDFTVVDKSSPERRSAYAFATRVDGRAFVVYGGKSDCGLVGDSWWWSNGSERWSPVKSSPVGLSCVRTKTTCAGLCG